MSYYSSSEGEDEEEQFIQCVEGQYVDMKYFPNNPYADGMIHGKVFWFNSLFNPIAYTHTRARGRTYARTRLIL